MSCGIFLAVKEKFFYLQPKSQTQYTISVDITMRANDISWSLTGVYETQSATEKRDFLMELLSLKQSMSAYLLLGDFDLIQNVADKN